MATRHTRLVVVLVLMAVASLGLGNVARAYEVSSVGDRFRDGLDSRHAAASLASAARAVGYTGTAHTNGQQVDAVWGDGLSAAVIGYFGHANAGYFQVYEGQTASDEFIWAGTDIDVVPLYSGFRAWTEYLPYVDVDDVRLAILAGCYTANTDAATGADFEVTGSERGMDAIVAFPGLVYYPASCSSCVYSGNYFWDRVAYYLKNGRTISTALAQARTDIINKEGKDGGWGRYRITGSVDNPAAVKITPAGPGEPLTSEPLGISPYSLATLDTNAVSEEPDGLALYHTEQGVVLRREQASGRVVDVVAPASTSGARTVSGEQALVIANAFVDQAAPTLDASLVAEDAEPISHVAGDDLLAFSWRRTHDAEPSAHQIDLEVDLRTGAVTYFAWARTDHEVTSPTISRAEAAAIAEQTLPRNAEILSIEAYTWDRSYWLVQARAPADSAILDAFVRQVLIDAATGAVTGHTTT